MSTVPGPLTEKPLSNTGFKLFVTSAYLVLDISHQWTHTRFITAVKTGKVCKQSDEIETGPM